MELHLGELNIIPLERNHLAHPQTGFAAEKNQHVRIGPVRDRRIHKVLVLLEVMKGGLARRNMQESDRARHPLDHIPIQRSFQHHTQSREHRVGRRWCFVVQVALDLLHVLVGDSVEMLLAHERDKMEPDDGLL